MELKRVDVVDSDVSSQSDLLDEVGEDFNDSDSDSSYDDDFSPDMLPDDFSGGMSTVERHSDLLKDIMDFDSYIKQLVNGWLGLVWSEEKSKYVFDPYKKPVMNVQGATWCSGVLITYARSNNVITTINETIYNEIMIDAGKVIYINVRARSEEFGIMNQGDASSVCVQMVNTIKLMLSGLGGGKMSEVLKTTVNRQESVVLNDNAQPSQGAYASPAPKKPRGVMGFMNKLING